MNNEIPDFNKKYTAKRAVILARVSSKEQEEGYSIEAQKHRLENYCLRRDLSVIRTFDFVESSTNGDRRHFMDLIKFVKSQKETIAIVADKVDRVQRSFKEYPLLDDLIQKGIIELHFNTENYVIHKDSVSQERLMWSMGVIMAQSYVDNLRDNVKRSIDQKLRLGEWIASAPIGYMNARDDKNRGTILIDQERAPLVRRLFEEFGKGNCTVGELTAKAKAWGLKSRIGNKTFLGKSKIYQILNNPFYYGRMVVKGKEYEHRYPALIDKPLFDKCQSLLKGWHLKPFKWGIHEFVFRGLLTCAVSGKTVSADRKKKKYANGKIGEWTYLRCTNPVNPDKDMWVREELALKQVQSVLKSFQIPADTLEALISHIRKLDHQERAFLKRQMSELQREYATVQNRLDNLMDLLLDRAIDKNEYDAKKQKLRNQQLDIETRLAANRNGDDSFKETLISMIALISDAYAVFVRSSIERKRELLNFVFANLSLQGDKLLFSLKKPFEQFVKCTTFDEWRHLVNAFRTNPELRALITNSAISNQIKDLLHSEPPCSE